jgi:endonuclease IV
MIKRVLKNEYFFRILKEMMYQHVRELIPRLYLSYGEFKKSGIIPKETFFTGIPRGGKFPRIASKMGFTQFGLFIDHLIREMLLSRFFCEIGVEKTSKKEWRKKMYPLYLRFSGNPNTDESVVCLDLKWYIAVRRLVIDELSSKNGKFEIEPEWIVDSVFGHPDLVVGDTIYDIKSTGHWNKMRIPTIFQLLSYYCLAKKLGYPIQKIGIILPAQLKILVVDVSKWKWEQFWEKLSGCCRTKIPIPEFIRNNLGSHLTKKKDLIATLKSWNSSLPCQIFLNGNLRLPSFTDRYLERLTQTIHGNLRCYIHTPYILNMSKVYDDNWNRNGLKEILDIGVNIGCLGVVIHTGRFNDTLSKDDALSNFRDAVIECAESASKKCPLLIETSAGEKGELLSNISDFLDFYTSLPKSVRSVVKLCFDTCHVFASGYTPVEALSQFVSKKVPIRLFHFNDSLGGHGCCKDRHAYLGEGEIGIENLIPIAEYAIANGIDFLTE